MLSASPPPRIICVGGAPSSGTTLLADLLDAVPGLACPPELNLFCIPDAFAFDEDFRRAACEPARFAVPARYAAPTAFFNRKYLDVTGFDNDSLCTLVRASASLGEFVQQFAARYAAFRGR